MPSKTEKKYIRIVVYSIKHIYEYIRMFMPYEYMYIHVYGESSHKHDKH